MSYILDALKKLEHEKSRKIRGDGMINITGSLFEHERPKVSGTAGRKMVLAVIAAVLVTFAVTWRFLPPDKARAPQPSQPAIKEPQRPVAKTENASVPLAASPVPEQAVLPTAATTSGKNISSPAKFKSSPPQAVVEKVAPVADDAAELLTMQELRVRMKNRKNQALSAEETIAAPADIKLSGIAWQEEHRARRAVINGYLMQEGGVVSGARITDIFQDRVRFSLSGKVFEIPLTASTLPALGK